MGDTLSAERLQMVGDDSANHFAGAGKMVALGSGSQRETGNRPIVEDCLNEFGTVYQKDVERVWEVIRSALMQEQS